MPGYIKLTRAKLCMDCDGIYEEGNICPKCGSTTWEYLRNWMKPLNLAEIESGRAALKLVAGGGR